MDVAPRASPSCLFECTLVSCCFHSEGRWVSFHVWRTSVRSNSLIDNDSIRHPGELSVPICLVYVLIVSMLARLGILNTVVLIPDPTTLVGAI